MKRKERGLKMVEKTIQARYRDVLKKLHTCRPCEKAGLKQLLDYYYYKGGAK